MRLLEHIERAIDPAQFQATLASIGVPSELVEQILQLSRLHGPELLTLVLASIGIRNICRGSTTYTTMDAEQDEEKKRSIRQDASGSIVGGNGIMATVALAAGNPLFLIPEIAAVLGALKAHLEARYPRFEEVAAKISLDVAMKITALLMGLGTTYAYATNIPDALPPLGLTALTVAFSGHMRRKLYHILTIGGGTAITLGSLASAESAYENGNMVGVVMSAAFLALNALFTCNEVQNVTRCRAGTAISVARKFLQRMIRDLFKSQ